MVFESPEEGEILTPTVCTTFFKRKVNQAGISTDEEVKPEEKRKTPKKKAASDVHLFRMGEFKRAVKISQLEQIEKHVENEKLTVEDKDDIMMYLMLHKGDLSGMKIKNMKNEEKIDLIAYTCFLTAGSINHLKPRDRRTCGMSPYNMPGKPSVTIIRPKIIQI